MTELSATERPRGRGFGLAALAVTALAGGGAAIWLASGPDAPQQQPVAQVEINEADGLAAIAADAPVQELGVGEDGDWRRGVQTHFVVGSADIAPTITLQAADFEPGRYRYDGDVVIAGQFTQPYVEITAPNIAFEQGIEADHLRLITPEGEEVWSNPEIATLRSVDGNTTYFTGFDAHVPRGDIIIAGSVIGDQIEMVAGRIDIAGDAIGTMGLAASQGENRDMTIRQEVRGTIYTLRDEDYLTRRSDPDFRTPLAMFSDQSIPAHHTREAVRWAAAPAATSVTIGGTTGEDVTIQTPRDVERAAEHAAWADRIQSRATVGPPAVGGPATDIDRRRPIP
ncbi:MAG: hypothetical protein KI792_09065 [Alphaproteobacteria bacterium]|nr:hypothetical protein [Alphaproteobacteria bacterium SS10]